MPHKHIADRLHTKPTHIEGNVLAAVRVIFVNKDKKDICKGKQSLFNWPMFN